MEHTVQEDGTIRIIDLDELALIHRNPKYVSWTMEFKDGEYVFYPPKNRGMTLYHGGLDKSFNLDDLDLFRLAKKQQKKGRGYAGFYLTESIDEAKNYTKQNGNDIGVFEVAMTNSLYEFQGRGQIERIKQEELMFFANQGYDMLCGPNIIGKIEYVLLNKDIIKSFQLQPVLSETKKL